VQLQYVASLVADCAVDMECTLFRRRLLLVLAIQLSMQHVHRALLCSSVDVGVIVVDKIKMRCACCTCIASTAVLSGVGGNCTAQTLLVTQLCNSRLWIETSKSPWWRQTWVLPRSQPYLECCIASRAVKYSLYHPGVDTISPLSVQCAVNGCTKCCQLFFGSVTRELLESSTHVGDCNGTVRRERWS
jgi:hypothetical protein